MTKDLVLGYATNCRFEDLYRFVKSARGSMDPSRVDIAIYIDSLGDRYSELAIRESVMLVPVPNIWKRTRASKLVNLHYHLWIEWLKMMARVAPPAHRPHLQEAYYQAVAEWIHPQAGRWLVFRDYLAVNSAYRMVLATDVRDVFFQASPFEGAEEGALHVFEQDGQVYGPGKNVDSDWIESIYGKKWLSKLGGTTSACVGTILASSSTMRHLIDLMAPEILRYRRGPVDQTMYNKVLLEDYKGPVIRHRIADGPILTLASDFDPWRIEDRKVMVGDRIVPVVHMYDRRPAIRELVEGLYPLPGAELAGNLA